MSLHSSGVLITAHDAEHECARCGHYSVVEVVDDAEIHESWWECPRCGTTYVEDF